MDDLATAVWRKSSRSSSQGQCVEVAVVADRHLVRDSKLGDASPVLAVPADQFTALLDGIKTSQL